MVRISDILKQKGQPPEPEKEKKEEKPAPSPKEPLKEETQKIEEKPAEGIQISKVMAKKEPEEREMELAKAMRQIQLSPEESKGIYNHLLEVIREILNNVEKDSPIDLREAYDIVRDIVDRIVLGDKELISLTTSYSEDNFLYCHSVNVCILSIDVGFGLGYNKSKLNELGLGALLHDIGMMKVLDIARLPRILSEDEYEQIKKHPIYSSDILSKIKEIQEEVILISQQNHERVSGVGYPKGLKGDQIHEYSKIVALVDIYEALTHPRLHRKAFEPHEAVRELLRLSSSDLFDVPILKLLLNRIGLYPVGSWVELNTGEIGKVISSHKDFPLRPKVNIIFGPEKERLPQMKSIDLSRYTNIYIKCSINPQELNLKLE